MREGYCDMQFIIKDKRMESTREFKDTIERYVTAIADCNPTFAAKATRPGKDIDGCIAFILDTVAGSGCNGFTDDEVYSMAVHYYEEDDIKTSGRTNCRVIVNHHVELTPEEIQEMREKAKRDIYEQEASRIRSAGRPKQKAEEVIEMSLFDTQS